MKKAACLALLAFVISFVSGCKSDSDVLVEFKGGTVTRGEFHKWLKSKRIKVEDVLKTKKSQEAQLNRLASEKIIINEAKKSEFLKEERMKLILDFSSSNFLVREFIKNVIQEDDDKKKTVVRVSHILLRGKPKPIAKAGEEAKINEEFEKQMAPVVMKAKSIIAQLNGGKKFEDLAKKYSQDSSKNTKGDRGYMLEGMMDGSYTKIAIGLDEDEYTKEPVKINNKVYIIKVTEKEDISINDIESVIENKSDQNKIKRYLQKALFDEYLESLKKQKDTKIDVKVLSGKDVNAVIFNVADFTFTVKDLNGILDMLMGKGPDGKKREYPLVRKEGFAQKYREMKLLERAAKQDGYDKDDEFLEFKASAIDAVIYREYLRKVSMVGVSVTDAEVRSEYNANKDKKYYRTLPPKPGKSKLKKPGKGKKVVLPFSKVKDRIKMMLTSKKKSQKMILWKDNLMKDHNIKIISEKLEGK